MEKDRHINKLRQWSIIGSIVAEQYTRGSRKHSVLTLSSVNPCNTEPQTKDIDSNGKDPVKSEWKKSNNKEES